MRQDSLTARPGVAADQTFNVHRRARLQELQSLLIIDIMQPVLDTELLLGDVLVQPASRFSDHLLFSRRDRARFVGKAFDRRRVAVG